MVKPPVEIVKLVIEVIFWVASAIKEKLDKK
jgi:hypothetical protein